MPELPPVVPMLSYEDVGAAADWLVRAFGFEEVERFDEDGEVVHVTLRHGSGALMLGRPGETYVNPIHHREQCETAARMYDVPWVVDGVYVRIDDVAAHHAQAKTAGAQILSDPESAHGARSYRVEDHEGHRWMFAQEE